MTNSEYKAMVELHNKYHKSGSGNSFIQSLCKILTVEAQWKVHMIANNIKAKGGVGDAAFRE